MKAEVDVKKLFQTLMDVQEKESDFNNVCGNETMLFRPIRRNLEELIFDSFGMDYDPCCNEITHLFSNEEIDQYISYYKQLTDNSHS